MGLFYTWGGVLGPVMAGAVFDRWQTYEPLLWALVGVFAVAGIFFASLTNSWPRHRPPAMKIEMVSQLYYSHRMFDHEGTEDTSSEHNSSETFVFFVPSW